MQGGRKAELKGGEIAAAGPDFPVFGAITGNFRLNRGGFLPSITEKTVLNQSHKRKSCARDEPENREYQPAEQGHHRRNLYEHQPDQSAHLLVRAKNGLTFRAFVLILF